jgi:hypothetical protein
MYFLYKILIIINMSHLHLLQAKDYARAHFLNGQCSNFTCSPGCQPHHLVYNYITWIISPLFVVNCRQMCFCPENAALLAIKHSRSQTENTQRLRVAAVAGIVLPLRVA